jgi:hypothetical protein
MNHIYIVWYGYIFVYPWVIYISCYTNPKIYLTVDRKIIGRPTVAHLIAIDLLYLTSISKGLCIEVCSMIFSFKVTYLKEK